MNNYLDTALSLILIFFIFSIIAYIVQEIVAINLNYRGNVLWNSLAQLLDKTKTTGRDFGNKPVAKDLAKNTDDFFSKPEINSLKKNLTKLPSYIPAANFALAMMSMASSKMKTDPVKKDNLFDNVKLGLEKYTATDGDIFEVMKDLAASSTDIKELQKKIEDWYNDYMDRVTGWYKSHTTITIRLIAIGITLFFNVNVIKLTKEIFINSQLRGTLAGMASNIGQNQQLLNKYENTTARIDSLNATGSKLSIDTLYNKLNITGLPLGWNGSSMDQVFIKDDTGQSITNIFFLLIGWGIAAGCISMGAPFWFDMLVKLVNVRRSGLTPETGNDKK
jgi:hypothetical protein